MGLQNQLSDVSSESVLVFMVVLVGKSVSYLHSLLLTILHNLGLFSPRFDPAAADNRRHFESSLYEVAGAGLANLVVLCDQLNLNRAFSYQNRSDGVDGELDMDCVVCLNRLDEGDHVRRLACRHVFHKDCFDGWLNHLNFNCPLCRTHLAPGESVLITRRRVAEDLLAWFPSH
ncbi:hypothetical protein ACP275_05G038400 [Erythranthe tilingii]